MPRISFSLDAASAAGASKQLRAYSNMFKKKSALLRTRLAEHIRESIMDSIHIAKDGGQDKAADIQVHTEHQGHSSVISVQGRDAILLEYGPGASSSAGGSASGTRTINGEEIEPGNTAATMPLYRSAEDAREAFKELAREVFS